MHQSGLKWEAFFLYDSSSNASKTIPFFFLFCSDDGNPCGFGSNTRRKNSMLQRLNKANCHRSMRKKTTTTTATKKYQQQQIKRTTTTIHNNDNSQQQRQKLTTTTTTTTLLHSCTFASLHFCILAFLHPCTFVSCTLSFVCLFCCYCVRGCLWVEKT